MNTKESNLIAHRKELTVSQLTINSLTIYLIGLALGLLIDLFLPFRVMSAQIFFLLGVLLIIFSSILILWAQSTSNEFRKTKEHTEIEIHHFKRGPYRLSRHPNYLGLTFLLIGFGFLIDSIIVVILALISFLIVHFALIRKEERLLEKKHKEHYLQYKKSVRTWM